MNTEQFKELNERQPTAVKIKVKANSPYPGYAAQGFDTKLEIYDKDETKLNLEVLDFQISGVAGNHPVLATFTVYVSDLEVDADVLPGFDASSVIPPC